MCVYIYTERDIHNYWNSTGKMGERNIVKILKPFASTKECISSLLGCQ